MINNVVLMGRLVADPELRTTTTGKSVATFRLAVDRSFSKSGEERQADFITIVAWEKTADFVCKYFSKGSMIALQGSIQTRNYEDKNRAKRTAVEVVAREVSFCGSKSETATSGAPTFKPNLNVSADSDFEEVDDSDDLPF